MILCEVRPHHVICPFLCIKFPPALGCSIFPYRDISPHITGFFLPCLISFLPHIFTHFLYSYIKQTRLNTHNSHFIISGGPFQKIHSNHSNAIEWYLNGPRRYYSQGYLNGILNVFLNDILDSLYRSVVLNGIFNYR